MYLNLKRKHIVIWSVSLMVLIFLIVFLAFKISEITYGKKLVLEDNQLNISSYYAEYDTTVISNKNINTYAVKEWYKSGAGTKLIYLDYMGNIVSVITTPESCYISNAGNKSYILTQNVYGNENILSLATYIDILNKNITCNCIKNTYDKNGEINVVYDVCNKENCMLSDGIKHMGITSFELTIANNMPITYNVYVRNKKEYACIVYNKFDVNIEILDDVFNIVK